jgi:hypothetical protein
VVDLHIVWMQALQIDRGLEVVRIRVELIEQVQKIRRRAGLARRQVGVHEVARGEFRGNQ